MKIGILTYHRSHNYGALLQAVALRTVLERQGFHAVYIDYWPAYHRQMYALFSFKRMRSFKSLRHQVRYLIDCIINIQVRRKRIANFNQFIAQYIEPYIGRIDDFYDIVVCGSDQIWRKQKATGNYNPVYFGKNNISAHRQVSYAASMGILPVSDSDKAVLRDFLTHLDFISVREEELQKFVQTLGFSVCHDLDPTLLLTKDNWSSLFNLSCGHKERYALYYMISDAFNLDSIREFATSKGMKLKVIHYNAISSDTPEHIYTASPSMFLKLLSEADFVFTSSFHGLAFSLIFQKQFLASFVRNSGRASSLLDSIGLSDYLISPHLKIIPDLELVNYQQINMKIDKLRKTSLNNLSNMLWKKD